MQNSHFHLALVCIFAFLESLPAPSVYFEALPVQKPGTTAALPVQQPVQQPGTTAALMVQQPGTTAALQVQQRRSRGPPQPARDYRDSAGVVPGRDCLI